MEFLEKRYRSWNYRVFGAADGEDLMILGCTVFAWSTRVTDGRTDTQTELRWLRRAIAVPAVARKNPTKTILSLLPRTVNQHDLPNEFWSSVHSFICIYRHTYATNLLNKNKQFHKYNIHTIFQLEQWCIKYSCCSTTTSTTTTTTSNSSSSSGSSSSSTRYLNGGIEGWVDLGVGYIPRWFTCPQTVTHPSSNRFITTQPGVDLTSHWCTVMCLHRTAW